MDEFSDIWIEQCEAARDIRDAWGARKALGYVVGEKLLNYIRAADSDPSWAVNRTGSDTVLPRSGAPGETPT